MSLEIASARISFGGFRTYLSIVESWTLDDPCRHRRSGALRVQGVLDWVGVRLMEISRDPSMAVRSIESAD